MAILYAPEIKAAYGKSNESPDECTGTYTKCNIQGSATVDETWIYRTFLQYDLSAIPYGSVIRSAKLRLYCYFWKGEQAANFTNNVVRVTEDWDELTLCWNNMPQWDANKLYLPADTYPPTANSWTDWDITSLVQEWVNLVHPNYGLHIKNNDEGAYRSQWEIWNRRYNQGTYATYIEIEYEPAAEYRISEVRMEEIAAHIRRITGTTANMTPGEIVANLATLPRSS